MSYINHSMGAYLRRNVIFPLYWKYIKRSNVLRYYQELRTHQAEENKKIQQKKLYKLIKCASEKIPYYKRFIKDHYIQFSEDTIFDDIKKFPILTKETITAIEEALSLKPGTLENSMNIVEAKL